MNKIPPFLRWILIGFGVLILLLTLAKDFVIKTAIEVSAPQIIGAKIAIGSFSLGLLSHKIQIRDFKLYNPPGFPNQVFVSVPEIAVEADINELVKGRMHFPLVIFNLNKVVIVKNKEGKLNIDSLKIIEEQKAANAANKGKPAKAPEFLIDTLKLNIGQVILEDHTHTPPTVEAYNVSVKDKTLHHVDGVPKLAAAVLIESVKPTAIRSAGLMAAQALLGVGFLPAVAMGAVVAQDDVKGDLDRSFKRVYQESLKMIQEIGSVKRTDEKLGEIFAKVSGADIVITIQDKGWNKSSITIKARKFLLPKLEIANGLLYQLKQRLK